MSDFDYSSLLGSLLGASSSYNTAKNVSSLSNQLKNSYSNPSSLYSNYSANDTQFYNQLNAQNAMSGRSTDAYKNGVAREAAYNNWLTQYRSNLANQLSSYSKSASTYGTSNPLLYLAGTLLSSKKGADGQTTQNPLTQKINSGIDSGLSWLGNATGLTSNNSQSNTDSDPIANNYATYGNDVSNSLSSMLGGTYNYGNSDTSSNDNTDNSYNDFNVSTAGTGGSSSPTYDTGGVSALTDLLGD